MKFYKEQKYTNYWNFEIYYNDLTAIYHDSISIRFFKNGRRNNSKNATYIKINEFKEFYLDDEYYGDQNDFTKESWRKFVKLQAFL
jgi:hypothetical protein